jgi:CubicO group peptidase (beta-lactamase class C family)
VSERLLLSQVVTEPEKAGLHAGRLERIAEHFEHNYLSTGKMPGYQVVVARRDHVAYAHSAGLRDRERALPMADDTIFRIFSMTKPIASVALMQLYERGMFQLIDPVHRYIPEWRTLQVAEFAEDGTMELVKPHRPMNIRDVLMHTTGLAGGLMPGNPIDDAYAKAVGAAKHGMTLEGATKLLAELPLKFHPGTQWNYGLSTDIVGRLVEIFSGQTLDEYLRTELFEPLGMDDTGFMVPADDVDRFAALYQYRPANPPSLMEDPTGGPYLRRRSYLSGAGGLVSTTSDYVRFCRMLLGGGQLDGVRVLGRKTLELMTVNHLPGGQTLQQMAIGGFGEAGFEGVGFGLGFAVGLGPAATAMAGSAGDFYWGGAASTAFWVDPDEDLFVVFMTQLYPSVAYPFRAQLRSLVYQAIDD